VSELESIQSRIAKIRENLDPVRSAMAEVAAAAYERDVALFSKPPQPAKKRRVRAGEGEIEL